MKKIIEWIKGHKIFMVVLIVALAGISFLFFRKESEEETNQQKTQVYTAEKGSIAVTVSGTGQVEAANQVDIKPQVAGDGLDVVQVLVENDQYVEKGALIAVLDSEDAQDSLRDAQLSLQAAEISYKEVKEQYDNKTKEETWKRDAAWINYQKSLNSYNDALKNLEDYNITAPISGTVTGLDYAAGDSISRDDVLTTIISGDMTVTISLNEVDAVQVEAGDPVYLTFDALENAGITAKGEVTKVDTIGEVESGVVTFDVEISFDSPSDLLKPGMSATADIEIENANNVITIPIDAVQTMGEESFVMVQNDDGTIERKTVEVGITNDATIEITSGLSEGDQVISTSMVSSGSSNDESSSGSLFQMGGPGGGPMR